MSRLNQIEEINKKTKKIHKLLEKEKDKNKLKEEVINILCEIEERIWKIIWEDKDYTSLERENIFKRYVWMYNIDTIYSSIDNYLWKLAEILYKEIKQKKIKLEHDIFEPLEIEANFERWTKEKWEFKVANKEKMFHRVLFNIWYESSNIQQFEEELNKDRMRRIPYQIFHLKEEDNQKTVLLCDEIWQATFVYDWLIDPLIFQSIQKWDEVNGEVPLKIIYRTSSYQKNLELALTNILSKNEKVEKIVNEEYEKLEEKEELTKEELLRIMYNYNWMTEQESYDYFMNFWRWSKNIFDSTLWFKIKGRNIWTLKTISWIKINWKIRNVGWFQEWVNKIFEWKNIKMKGIKEEEELTKEELLRIMYNYNWMTEQESYDYFMSFWLGDVNILNSVLWFEIKGRKIVSLITLSWVKIEWKSQGVKWFKKWINKIFEWKDIEKKELELTKKELFKLMHNYEWRTVQESYDYFMNFWRWNTNIFNSLRGFKIRGKKIFNLSTISWIKIEWDINNIKWFQEWINKVFEWKDIKKKKFEKEKQKEKEKLLKLILNYNWMTLQESYDYFMNFWNWDVNKFDSLKWFKINWNGVKKLKTILGIKIKWHINTVNWFQEWINKIFEWKAIVKKEEKDKDELLKLIHNYNWMSKQESYDYFMNFWTGNMDTFDSVLWFKINWQWIRKLKSILGIETKLNIQTVKWFRELINKVFEWNDIKK